MSNGLSAELIEQYGEDAFLIVGPHVLDSLMDDFRWVVQIDADDPPEMDVYVREDLDFPGQQILSIGRALGGEELKVLRWTPENGIPYTRALRTLRDLRDNG